MIGNYPAFPSSAEQSARGSDGMTIRQYFVAQAMRGCINLVAFVHDNSNAPLIADYAIKIADACLAREAETMES
jgi:hypothetical protein